MKLFEFLHGIVDKAVATKFVDPKTMCCRCKQPTTEICDNCGCSLCHKHGRWVLGGSLDVDWSEQVDDVQHIPVDDDSDPNSFRVCDACFKSLT